MAVAIVSNYELVVIEGESNMRFKSKKFLAKLGLLLILTSGLFFAMMLSAPFLPFGTGLKVMLAGVAFVCMQIAWWVGVAMIGPEAAAKMKSWINRSTSNKISRKE